jgi:hypothetical protein
MTGGEDGGGGDAAAMSEQLDHVADTRHVITMSTPIQTQVEPDSEAPTAIYQVTTTPEPPNRGTCHVATPPEPEQAEIEAKPAATERVGRGGKGSRQAGWNE